MAEDTIDISSGSVSGRVKRRGAKGNVVGDTTISRPVASPSARPVDTTIMPSDDTALSALAEGLSAASPGFEKYLNAKHEEYTLNEAIRAKRQAQIELMDKDEITEEILKGNLKPEDSPWFQEAYFKHGALLQAQNTAKELRFKYDTEFDKDNGDINSFIKDNLKISERDLSDPDFAEPYLNALTDVENDIKKEQGEYHSAKIDKKKKTDIMLLVDNIVIEAVQANKPIQWLQENLNSMYVAGKEVFLTNQDVDELIFNSIVANSDAGLPELISYFSLPKPDGTPGLYYNPDYTAKIDAAFDAAVNQKDANKKADKKIIDDAKKAKFEKTFLDAATLLDAPDPSAGATQLLKILSNEKFVQLAADVGKSSQLQSLRNTARTLINSERKDADAKFTKDRKEANERLLAELQIMIQTDQLTSIEDLHNHFTQDTNDRDLSKIFGEYKALSKMENDILTRQDKNHHSKQTRYQNEVKFIKTSINPTGQGGITDKFYGKAQELTRKANLAARQYDIEVAQMISEAGGFQNISDLALREKANDILSRPHFHEMSGVEEDVIRGQFREEGLGEAYVEAMRQSGINKMPEFISQFNANGVLAISAESQLLEAVKAAEAKGDTREAKRLDVELNKHIEYYEERWRPK